MPDRARARAVHGVVVATALAAVLAAAERQPVRPGQSVYIVAARDSGLLTLCVETKDSRGAGVPYRETDSPVMVMPGPRGTQMVRFLDGRGGVTLPEPSGASLRRRAAASTLEPAELDRQVIAPDAGLREELAREIPGQSGLRVADRADAADLVLVAEALWVPLIAWGERNTHVMQWGGDFEANFRQAILAIAVPAADYLKAPGDIATLVGASVWDTAAVYQLRPALVPAGPAALAKALAKGKRPANTPPVCAAAAGPASIEAVDPSTWRARVAGPDADGARAGAAAGGSGSRPVFRSAVTYVSVPVTVVDAGGQVIDDLKPAEFVLEEDGVAQAVDRLVPLAEPFDVTALVDTSASMRLRVESIQEALLGLVETLRPGDRVTPVSFNDRVTVHAEAPSDRAKARISIFQIGRGEGTRLYDALELVRTFRLDRAATRQAVVLFTDGVDTRSRLADGPAAVAALEASQVPVYVIEYDAPAAATLYGPTGTKPDIVPRGALDGRPLSAEASRYLGDLADRTGGRLWHAATAADLPSAFAEIGRELNGQYTIWYYPSNQARDGATRRITVGATRPGARVARARTSYRASK